MQGREIGKARRISRLEVIWGLIMILSAGSTMARADRSGDLTAPADTKIMVAFVLGPHATMIDFAGPWEVFQDVHVPGRGETHDAMMPFELFTVAETTDAITATGGMRILPDYSFDDAPQPQVIVVPAVQSSEAMLQWLRRASRDADVTMSVCTGAFVVARAGLLSGKRATTHHDFVIQFAERFPDIELVEGSRYVENEAVSSAAGLTSGIDLALRVVERYFGTEVAAATAEYMEYQSSRWQRPVETSAVSP